MPNINIDKARPCLIWLKYSCEPIALEAINIRIIKANLFPDSLFELTKNTSVATKIVKRNENSGEKILNNSFV